MTDSKGNSEARTSLWSHKLAVFDLETTGLDLSTARIVTAFVGEIDERGLIEGTGTSWLANPGIEIPEVASSVHGITTAIAREKGKDASEVVSEILTKLSNLLQAGVPVVAYNAPYDFTILHHEALRHGLVPIQNPKPIVDPLVIDRFVDQYRPGKRTLATACSLYGVELGNAHEASADAIAAGLLAQVILKEHAVKLPTDFQELHNSQREWSLAQDNSYQEFRRRSDPSFNLKLGWPLKI